MNLSLWHKINKFVSREWDNKRDMKEKFSCRSFIFIHNYTWKVKFWIKQLTGLANSCRPSRTIILFLIISVSNSITLDVTFLKFACFNHSLQRKKIHIRMFLHSFKVWFFLLDCCSRTAIYLHLYSKSCSIEAAVYLKNGIVQLPLTSVHMSWILLNMVWPT